MTGFPSDDPRFQITLQLNEGRGSSPSGPSFGDVTTLFAAPPAKIDVNVRLLFSTRLCDETFDMLSINALSTVYRGVDGSKVDNSIAGIFGRPPVMVFTDSDPCKISEQTSHTRHQRMTS